MIIFLKTLKVIVIVSCPVGAISYFLVRPYCDTLKQFLLCGAFGPPALVAIFLPAVTHEGPEMILIYFLIGVVITSITTTVLFYIDRLITKRVTEEARRAAY